MPLLYGVPQGSALGPLLFHLYTADVAVIAESYGVHVHSYADDTQLYTSCSALNGWLSSLTLQMDVVQLTEIKCRQDTVHLAGFSPDVSKG
jgi:hypothetical protein